MIIIGKQPVHYTNKEGKTVDGLKLYGKRSVPDCEGYVSTNPLYVSQFIMDKLGIDFGTFDLDDEITPLYDDRGHLVRIDIS